MFESLFPFHLPVANQNYYYSPKNSNELNDKKLESFYIDPK